MNLASPEVDVLLPVHNEASSIEGTLREIHGVVSAITSMRFLVCEDGSTDGTPDVLRRLAGDLPICLVSGQERKGYARAVVDGFAMAKAPYLLFLDSDGQMDPNAFIRAWPLRTHYDVVIGWRVRRADAVHRRLMSSVYRSIYQMLFRVPLHDPSCPFLLVRREVTKALVGDLGTLTHAFWWEFIARVFATGFRLTEVPINHRERPGGGTRVYPPRKIPGIAWSELRGLFEVKRQLRDKSLPRS